MNIYDDYQQKALKTLLLADTNYTLQKIVGESGELIEKLLDGNNHNEVAKECGDVLWYCATSSHLLDIPFSQVFRSVSKHDLQVFTPNKIYLQCLLTGARIVELNGKGLRQGLTDSDKQAIINYIGDITSDVDYIIKYYNLGPIVRILDQNIEKLAQRKFNNTLMGTGDNR